MAGAGDGAAFASIGRHGHGSSQRRSLRGGRTFEGWKREDAVLIADLVPAAAGEAGGRRSGSAARDAHPTEESMSGKSVLLPYERLISPFLHAAH